MQRKLPLQTLLLVGAFVAGFRLIAEIPASTAAGLAGFGRHGMTHEGVSGTIWNGKLRSARVHGLDVGDVDFALRAPSLFLGRLKADVKLSGGALTGAGAVGFGVGGLVTIEDSAFELDLGVATRYNFLGAPLKGRLSADVGRVALRSGKCEDALIRFDTDVLAEPARRLKGQAFVLSGDGSCRDGSFVASLSGQGQDGAGALTVEIAPDLSFALHATAQPARSELSDALRALGFKDDEGRLTLAMSGVVRAGS